MKTINSKADLNRLVAETVFCPEPPLSERRAIHKSGAWLWDAMHTTDCAACDGTGNFYMHDADGDFLPCDECREMGEFATPQWQPADFCGDPVASYRLEEKMRGKGYQWLMDSYLDAPNWVVSCTPDEDCHLELGTHRVSHESRFVAMAVSVLRSLAVEFSLAEGWDQ